MRVALGRVGQITQDVGGAQLVDQAGEGGRVVVLIAVVDHHAGQLAQPKSLTVASVRSPRWYHV
jgi:hypothetical protein